MIVFAELIESGVLRHTPAGSPAVFLDRDGVLNRKIDGGYVLSADSLEYNESLIEALAPYSSTVPMVVVSNQRCVSRGLIGASDLRRLMTDFTSALAERGLQLTAWYCCPHGDEDACGCRKPEPGMIAAASARFDFDLERSCIIGDSETDMAAGTAAGIGTCIRYSMDPVGETARVGSLLNELYAN